MLRNIDGRQRSLDVNTARVTRDGDRWVVNGGASALTYRDGDDWLISFRGRTHRVSRTQPDTRRQSASTSGELTASMPGVIVGLRVQVGDEVPEGTTLVVLEAMKTQQPLKAPFLCRIDSINVEEGKQVVEGAVLVTFSPIDSLPA